MRRLVHVQCERCGNDVTAQARGRFRDEDYVELLHEFFDYQERAREYARMHRSAHNALFFAEIDADLWRHQAVLYRAQLVEAGIAPMDALQGQTLEQPEPEYDPFADVGQS